MNFEIKSKSVNLWIIVDENGKEYCIEAICSGPLNVPEIILYENNDGN